MVDRSRKIKKSSNSVRIFKTKIYIEMRNEEWTLFSNFDELKIAFFFFVITANTLMFIT